MKMSDSYLDPTLRMQNIFAPDQLVGANQPTMVTTPGPTNQYQYTPEHTATDRLTQLLGNMPQREAYHPSLMRRIVASLGGLGRGPQGAEYIMDQPYNEAMQDWQNRYQPAYQAANLERYANANERQLAYQQGMLGNRDYANWIRERDLERKITEGQDRIKISAARAAAYAYKAHNPNHEYKIDNQGRYFSVDPQTDQTEYLRDPEGDFITADKLPQEEFLAQKHDYRMAEIEAGAGARAQNVDTSGWETLYDPNDDTTYRVNPRTGERIRWKKGRYEKPGTPEKGGTKEEIPSRQRDRLYNRAKEISDNFPQWRKYIRLNPRTKDFKVATPQKSWLPGVGYGSTPDPQTYHTIIGLIYGTSGATMGATPKGGTIGPKIGDTKDFPNGRKGKWDGKGWVEVK